jgi:hypothetical protein
MASLAGPAPNAGSKHADLQQPGALRLASEHRVVVAALLALPPLMRLAQPWAVKTAVRMTRAERTYPTLNDAVSAIVEFANGIDG